MKQALVVSTIVGAVAAPAFAQQAPIPADLRAMQRGDWGCEVLLCLANPAGPTAAPPCEPPIRRLWRHLAKGRSFPTCSMANGPGGRSYARPNYSYYDPCPAGTSELPVGEFAQLAAAMTAATVPVSRSGAASSYTVADTGFMYSGIGPGDGFGYSAGGDSGPPPAKICVAGFRGQTMVGTYDSPYSVSLYDSIYVAPAAVSPNAIDVCIDESVWQRVRW